MPTEIKSLFRTIALRAGLARFELPPAAGVTRPRVEAWAKLIETGAADKKKETELLPEFISGLFEAALDYTRPLIRIRLNGKP